MKKILSYKCKDGSTWEDKKDAILRDKRLELEKRINKINTINGFSEPYVITFLVNTDAKTIRKILSGY